MLTYVGLYVDKNATKGIKNVGKGDKNVNKGDNLNKKVTKTIRESHKEVRKQNIKKCLQRYSDVKKATCSNT